METLSLGVEDDFQLQTHQIGVQYFQNWLSYSFILFAILIRCCDQF